MIHIEKDKEIFNEINLKVASETGDYEDNALIEFYNVANPSIIAGAFQAQYVKYGNMVYTHNGHMELGAAILKIDPESTHTSASYVRMSRELLSQMNEGSLESTSLNDVLEEEKKNIDEKLEKTPIIEEELSKEVPIKESIETPVEEIPPEIIPEKIPVVEIVPEPVVEEEGSLYEIIPKIEDILPEPVAKIIRKTTNRKIT